VKYKMSIMLDNVINICLVIFYIYKKKNIRSSEEITEITIEYRKSDTFIESGIILTHINYSNFFYRTYVDGND